MGGIKKMKTKTVFCNRNTGDIIINDQLGPAVLYNQKTKSMVAICIIKLDKNWYDAT